MRAYERISFNLKQIKFKENKEFLDSLLEKYGYKYKNIAFDFALGSENDFQRINKNFPALIKYKMTLPSDPNMSGSDQETYFSSVRDLKNGEDIFVDSKDIPQFCALLNKIPNTINFGSMEVVLDGIDWYGDGSGHKAGKPKHNFFAFAKYFNNTIRYIKHWDSGNKYNIIDFVIDRTLSDEEIRPYPEAFEKMLAELGKPLSKNIECVFEEEEQKAWEEAKKPLQNRILKEDFSGHFDRYKEESQKLNSFSRLLEGVQPENLSGFSPKKGFNKAAKKYGFKYNTCADGCYIYKKINENNHTITVELTKERRSKIFGTTFVFTGCNFHHYYKNLPQTEINDENEAEEFAESSFLAALEFEEKYDDEMLKAYGKTPKWYK